MPKGKEDSNKSSDEGEREFSDEETYQGTSKGVTRERHCTSHKVIFVDNLPSSFDKQDFINMFQKFGEILDIKFLKHKTGPETGYGFVEFAEEKNGRKAIRDWNWKMKENRIVRVSRAKPSTNKLSGTNLYVENVPVDWNDQMLFDYFSRICNTTLARILMDQKKEVSRGVGFVHCASNREAKKAIRWFNREHPEENGLKLNVKFAKIPRADRTSQRDRKGECQEQQKGSNNQSSKDVGESGLSPRMKDCELRQQESSNNEMQGDKSVQKNWYKYNEQALLSHGKGLRLPSVKNPRTLSKSKRRKKRRRKQFQKRQLKKAMKREIQNAEISNISKAFGSHLNTNAYQRQLIKTSNGPSMCGVPTFPVPDRGQDKRVEKYIRVQMPYTNMPKSNPPTQLFMNQQYKTAQLGGNIVGNCVYDNTQPNQMSPQATFPVMCNAQRLQPIEYASSVATSASSIMSSPLGPTPVSHSTPCASMQAQTSNVQANTMYWTGLPVPYTQWQPLTNPKDTNATKNSVKTKVVGGNQMQQFGCKKDSFENCLVGGGTSVADFGGHQMNLNPQIGVNHSYYWPESHFMTQVVNPSGYPLQAQQRCWSTDSCSSIDSFNTVKEDYVMYYNTMNQVVPGGVMHYANVQAQNPIIQTNSVCRSESNQFDPTSQLQHSINNLSICGVDTRSDTTSIQSDIGLQPFQCKNVFQAARTAAPAQKILGNHIKMGVNYNGGSKPDLAYQQQPGSPQLYMTNVVNSGGMKQQNSQYWSTASTCNTEVSSVINVNQSLKKEPAIPNNKAIEVCNLPVKVKLIPSEDCSGFNYLRKVNNGPFNGFEHKSKASLFNGFKHRSKAKKNRFNGFKHKSKGNKNPLAGFNIKQSFAPKPVTRSGFNRKPKMELVKRNCSTINNRIHTN